MKGECSCWCEYRTKTISIKTESGSALIGTNVLDRWGITSKRAERKDIRTGKQSASIVIVVLDVCLNCVDNKAIERAAFFFGNRFCLFFQVLFDSKVYPCFVFRSIVCHARIIAEKGMCVNVG